MRFDYKGGMIEVVQGDITRVEVDAIVNAANEGLRGGGGVDGAIHRAGGPSIMEECRTIGHCPTGLAVMTTAGRLPAKHVIHTVGPVWRERGDEVHHLRSAIQSALALADAYNVRSISIPAVSSGIFGFPKPLAARVIWDAVQDYFTVHSDSGVHDVHFCNIDHYTTELFCAVAQERFSSQSNFHQ